jgi:threonyl-tRNA synthetase
MRRAIDAAGYKEVKTPQVMDARQWEQSGHWGKYRENMFVIPDEVPNVDDEGPVISRRGRLDGAEADELPGARADLPQGIKPTATCRLRIYENGCCHRNEPHGALHGLMRVRQFTQDDAHIFCREDQIVRGSARFLRAGRPHLQGFRFHKLFDQAGAAPRKALRQRCPMWDKAEQELRDAVIKPQGWPRGIWLGRTARRRRVLCAQARMAPDRRDRPHLAGRHDPVRPGAARTARRQLHRRGRRSTAR